MNYLSVCSGIEAATMAWHPLGWTPVGFGEIEKFPCQVLAHHYPDVTNFGDMTKFKEWSIESNVNVLVGGTPCQSFSVAGLRKGLDDPRGNLMLTYLAIAAKYRPRWLVWENVPGVLSSNSGLDFASLLRGMGECGYGFAYRILDAQYFGVAQRRRRVFVVGYLGNWRPAAAVLFERHSLQGHPAPSRKAREGVAASTGFSVTGSVTGGYGSKLGTDEACQGSIIPAMHSEVCPALKARDAKGPSSDGDGDGAILVPMMQHGKGWNDDGTAYTVDTHATQGVAQPIAYTLSGGSNRGLHVNKVQVATCLDTHNAVGEFREQSQNAQTLVAQTIPIDTMNHIGRGDKHSMGDFVSGAPSYTLTKHHSHAVAQPIAFSRNDDGRDATHNLAPTMRVAGNAGGMLGIATAMAVRRLTVKECERLQGFPDGYTDIQPKGKATPDGPRYKALGNSMAVPVMRWIGERIATVEKILV